VPVFYEAQYFERLVVDSRPNDLRTATPDNQAHTPLVPLAVEQTENILFILFERYVSSHCLKAVWNVHQQTFCKWLTVCLLRWSGTSVIAEKSYMKCCHSLS
jgi:hypothetical protein